MAACLVVRCSRVKLLVPAVGNISIVSIPGQCRYRYASTSAPQNRSKLRTWSGQRGVQIPKKKIVPKNAVLKTLAEAVRIDWATNTLHPCDTLELAPASIGMKRNSLVAAQRAKESVQLITNDSELLSKGMKWVGETKANMDYIKISAGDGENPDSTGNIENVIEDAISHQNLQNLLISYKAMIEENISLTSEMKEKLIGTACFIAAQWQSKTHLKHENLQYLNEIIEMTEPLSKTMLLAVIKCYINSSEVDECVKYFKMLVEHGFKLDIETAGSLLNMSVPSSLKDDIRKMCESVGTPTAAYVFASFPSDKARRLTSQQIMEMLSKYIVEANYCTNDSELQILVEALSLVSQKLSNRTILYALLTRMNSFGSEKVQNCDGFVEAMLVAERSSDVQLAHKIVDIATQHCFELPQRFFVLYIICLAKLSTPEVFMENAAKYLGPVIQVTGAMFDRLVQICSQRQWPQALPLLFSTYDNPFLNHRYYSVWLFCATKMADKADEDCVVQYTSVADILVKFLKVALDRTSTDFRTNLVDLMIKCQHEDGLEEFLRLANKYPSLKEESSYKSCELAIKTNS